MSERFAIPSKKSNPLRTQRIVHLFHLFRKMLLEVIRETLIQNPHKTKIRKPCLIFPYSAHGSYAGLRFLLHLHDAITKAKLHKTSERRSNSFENDAFLQQLHFNYQLSE